MNSDHKRIDKSLKPIFIIFKVRNNQGASFASGKRKFHIYFLIIDMKFRMALTYLHLSFELLLHWHFRKSIISILFNLRIIFNSESHDIRSNILHFHHLSQLFKLVILIIDIKIYYTGNFLFFLALIFFSIEFFCCRDRLILFNF